MYSIFMDKVFLIFVHMLVSVGQNVRYIENSGQEIRRRYQTLGYLLSNQHCYMADTDLEKDIFMEIIYNAVAYATWRSLKKIQKI